MSTYRDQNEMDGPNDGKTGAKVAAGCGLGCLGIAVVAGALLFFWMRGIQSKVDAIAANASSEPTQFETPDLQVHEVDDVIKRFDDFRTTLAASEPTSNLVLSARDINILLNHHSSFEPLAGRAQIRFFDNQIVSDVSIDPEDFPFKIPVISKAFEGKYINGTATTDLAIKDGEATMYLLNFRVAEWELPPQMLKAMASENLLKNTRDDKGFTDFIEKIEELKIDENKLHIVPKNAAVESATPVAQ